MTLTLFGGFRLMRSAGDEIVVASKRAQAILAYLALNSDQQITREKLAGLLWQDRGEEQARHSLRQELSVLRKAMGDLASAVVSTGDRLALDTRVMAVDVWLLERQATARDSNALEQGAALYTGDLLDGLNIGSQVFREWCAAERARLADLAYGVMERLAETRASEGAPEEAIDVARRLATLDPLRERAHRLLMRLYVNAGRRPDAIRQFRTCVRILSRELDVEPERETLRLYDKIRAPRAADETTDDQTSFGRPKREEALKALPLPSKPSIAVLPFDNLSGDIEQEYFADGIAEDIITILGRFRWCFVIARNSTFAYKGSGLSVREIARELGVRYVLEGSVRKAGQRVRVTAELSEAASGRLIWAEKYDRELGDIFAMQDEISETVIASIATRFPSAEAERAQRKDPASFDAWDYCIRARWHLWRFNQEDSTEAKRLLRKSLELDPGFAPALADLAALYVIDAMFGWRRSEMESLTKARSAAGKALHYDDQDPWAHAVVALVDLFSRKYEESIHGLIRALDVNPSFPIAHGFLGWVENVVGNTDRAVEEIETAIRLSPRDPFMVVWHAALAGAAFFEGCYGDAAAWARRAVEDRGDFPMGHRLLAASLGQMGDEEGARVAVREVLRLIPDLTIDKLRNQVPYREQDLERFLEGLRRGGLPE